MKPARGKLNLNIDADFHANGSGAVGAVLRDHNSEALAGMACPVMNLLSPATVEATALLKGLEFLEQIGCSSVYIELDSLELVQACTGEIEVWSPYTAILVECF
jgi:ribonuclease HI